MRSSMTCSMRRARRSADFLMASSASSRSFSPSSRASCLNSSGGITPPPALAAWVMIWVACVSALPTMDCLSGSGRSGIGVGSSPHGRSPAGIRMSRIHALAARHFTSVSGAQTMFPPPAACITPSSAGL